MLWTAHGVKLIPSEIKFNVQVRDGARLSVSPSFDAIISDVSLNTILDELQAFPALFYDQSMAVNRNCRRIPLKPPAVTPDEGDHLALRSDGLRFFHPLRIHQYNCQDSEGVFSC